VPTTRNPKTHPLIQRLIRRRLHLGLSQAKVAEQGDIARATVSSMESGHSSPSLRVLDAYCQVVGLRPYLALMEEEDHPRGYVLVIDDPD
jgi:transcriptional regulator with XRE-family HTH domain